MSDKSSISNDLNKIFSDLPWIRLAIKKVSYKGFSKVMPANHLVNLILKLVMGNTIEYCKTLEKPREIDSPLLTAAGQMLHDLFNLLQYGHNSPKAEGLRKMFEVADLLIVKYVENAKILYSFKSFEVYTNLANSMENTFEKVVLAMTFLEYSDYCCNHGLSNLDEAVKKLIAVNNQICKELGFLFDLYEKLKFICGLLIDDIVKVACKSSKPCVRLRLIKKWEKLNLIVDSLPMQNSFADVYLSLNCNRKCYCNELDEKIHDLLFISDILLFYVEYLLCPSAQMFKRISDAQGQAQYSKVFHVYKNELVEYTMRHNMPENLLNERDNKRAINAMHLFAINAKTKVYEDGAIDSFNVKNAIERPPPYNPNFKFVNNHSKGPIHNIPNQLIVSRIMNFHQKTRESKDYGLEQKNLDDDSKWKRVFKVLNERNSADRRSI